MGTCDGADLRGRVVSIFDGTYDGADMRGHAVERVTSSYDGACDGRG